MFASGIRVALSALRPFGGVIGDFLTQFVPQQRLDRLTEFVEILHEQMEAAATSFQQRVETSAPYAALLEESTLAAVRTPSSQRRRDIVEILRTGLSKSDAEVIGHHALLRLLENLNEAEIIVLMSLGSFRKPFNDPEVDQFYEKHDAVLGIMPPNLNASLEEHRRWMIRDHYDETLISRGLARDTEGIVKSGPQRTLAITPLGSMLLQAIGRPVADEV